jgi:ribonuclease-3 family protein
VNAKAQSDLFQKIKDELTEEEMQIYKRGRNTNSHPPKNADMVDYKSATGVEALIGFLYLSDKADRIAELLKFLTD